MWKKFIVVVVLFLPVFTQCEEMDPAKVMKIITTCAKDTHTEQAEYENPQVFVASPSENMLCMAKCVAENLGILDNEGKFSKEALTEFTKEAPEEMGKEVLACGEKVDQIKECKDMEKVRQCVLPSFMKVAKP